MDKNTIKKLALLEELEISNKLIKLGLGEIQSITFDNDFYFLPFQLLSQGFERFMKAYVCLGYFDKKGVFPDFKYLKNLGHDLESLLNEILEEYFLDYNRPQYKIDENFLVNDNDLKELLFILSEFGKLARYHNFDIITDSTKISINTVESWRFYESKLISKKNISLKKIVSCDINSRNEVYHEISNHIIIIFERFVSSLARQFNFNNLGSLAKQLTAASFLHWGMLYEEDFGKTDYRKNTTKYIETPKKVHKRTTFDEANRLENPNYKSKKILKSDFENPKEWPFFVDEVIIESRYKNWYIITIEGYDYSLNGLAKSKYKLDNPHDAGMADLGISLSKFIDLAREL